MSWIECWLVCAISFIEKCSGKTNFEKLIACTRELAEGQILFLSWYNDIFSFRHKSRRVTRTGWKALTTKAGT